MNWPVTHAIFGVVLIIGALMWATAIIARPKLRPRDLFEVIGLSIIIVIVSIVIASAAGLIASGA